MSVEGKIVAITGVTSGIGRTTAEVFARRGAAVVGCGRRRDRGAKVQQAITSAGGRFEFVAADVTIWEDCRRFVDATVAAFGRIDVLINNAGGGGSHVATDRLSEQEFDELLRLNLHGALFCTQRAVDHMIGQSAGGVVLNIASVQGVLAVAGSAAYNVAKAGLIQLGNTVAVEYLGRGVRANTIVMGGAPTAASARAVREITGSIAGADDTGSDRFLPPPLTGTPLDDVAAALVALAGDDARAITGAVIAIDQAQTAGSLYSDAVFHALSGAWPRPS